MFHQTVQSGIGFLSKVTAHSLCPFLDRGFLLKQLFIEVYFLGLKCVRKAGSVQLNYVTFL